MQYGKIIMKNVGKYHNNIIILYVQSDTLLLADVFEIFRNMCLKIFELDPARLLSASGLLWQASLKKSKVKLDLLTDIDLLLMVEKVLEEECVTLFTDMQKLITNTWKIMMKIKNRHILNIGM